MNVIPFIILDASVIVARFSGDAFAKDVLDMIAADEIVPIMDAGMLDGYYELIEMEQFSGVKQQVYEAVNLVIEHGIIVKDVEEVRAELKDERDLPFLEMKADADNTDGVFEPHLALGIFKYMDKFFEGKFDYEKNLRRVRMFCDSAAQAEVHMNKIQNSLKNLMTTVLNTGDNTVFSPAALYMALVVLAKITDGDTRGQICRVLGAEYGMLYGIYEKMNASSVRDDMATCAIASSLWMNDSMSYHEDRLEELKDELGVESYAGSMGTEDMDNAITEWVNANTGNLLSDQVDIKTTASTLLELLTTIYMKARWGKEFYKEATKVETFYGKDGKETQCEFMNQIKPMQYHAGENFTAVTKSLWGGFEGIFVLPDNDVSVGDICSCEQLYELVFTGSVDGSEEYEVEVSMPKFDVSSKIDLKDMMYELGIEDAFVAGRADFSPISDMGQLCIAKAEQTSRFKVDEDGVEATSFVEMGIAMACLPPRLERVSFKLNRPFLFVVTGADKVPVFAGKVEQI